MERLPTEDQERPRRHFAALSGRDRVMAETYGEGGGRKRESGVWAQGDAACGYGAGLCITREAGSGCMGQGLVDAGRGLVNLRLSLIGLGGA